jgi:hypothetical protein
MNKYKKWYDQITQNGKTSKAPGDERHHIVPRSLNGADDLSNIAFISPREHFICHWLLTKIYPTGEEHWKMINAFRMMRAENPNQQRYSTKITSRVYENLKKEYSLLQSTRVSGENNPMYGRTHTEEAKRAISKKNVGKKLTAQQIAKQIESQTGRKRAPFTDEWRANLSAAKQGKNNPRYGTTTSESTRKKMSEKATGRKQSDETIKKKADAIRGSKREKLLCPHCAQLISVNTYPRWHGDRCKHKLTA